MGIEIRPNLNTLDVNISFCVLRLDFLMCRHTTMIHNGTLLVVDEQSHYRDRLACFDLDHTLITTKSGRVHPKNLDDWQMIAGVREMLTKLTVDHSILVFSNQKGVKDVDGFVKKLRAISAAAVTKKAR